MSRTVNVIVLPSFYERLFGWKCIIRLTPAETRAMARIHNGGVDALSVPGCRTTRQVIDSLVAKGLLDRNGTTDYGKIVAEKCSVLEHERITGELEEIR